MSLPRKIYSYLIDTVQTFIFAASIFALIYFFFFRPFQVSGSSMFPNFHDGEYVLTNLISLRFSTPKRGDVVVFSAPPEREKDYIKRVIGLPGETIALKNNHIYINDKILDESSYLKSSVITYGGAFLYDGIEKKIPDNNYFVMGDNREHSSDSREWGFVSKDKLIGESFLVYWPTTSIRIITNQLKPD